MTKNPTHQSVARKLEELRARYETITGEMSRPQIASDPVRIVELAREHGQLKRILEPYEAYRKAIDDIRQSESLLADADSDPEIKALAAEELASARTRADELMTRITGQTLDSSHFVRYVEAKYSDIYGLA